MNKEWIKLTVVENEQAAVIICERLKEEGVEAVYLNKKDSSYLVGEVEIYCLLEQAHLALNILGEQDSNE